MIHATVRNLLVPRLLAIGLVTWGLSAAPALAQSYETGLKAYDDGQFEQALDIWLPLADGGHPIAQYSLGKLYEEGQGPIQRDPAEAAKWYRKAADQGIAAASNNLGLMYSQGAGVTKDLSAAAELWRSAAERGHPMAQYNIGLAYFNGDGVSTDRTTAAQWFRRAAEAGVPEAQYVLGQFHRQGIALKEDPQRALSWYRMAAAQGHQGAEEQVRLLEDELGIAGDSGDSDESAAMVAKSEETETDAPAAVAAADTTDPDVNEAEVQSEPLSSDAAPGDPVTSTTASTEVAPALETTAASMTPSAEPAADSSETEEQMESDQMAAKAPEEEPEDVAAMTSTAEGVRIWIGTAGSEGAAESMWQTSQGEYPALLSNMDAQIAQVDLGTDGVLYRVTAGPVASKEAGESLCDAMRGTQPYAFCKVQVN